MTQHATQRPWTQMLLRTPMGFWLVVFALGLLAGAAPAAAQTSPRAGDAPPSAPAYKPDARFLRDEPFRKTKQLVQLTGVKSEAELATVRGAINDVVGFVRLFGITGSNVGSAVVTGASPEQMAEIRAARVTWQAFEDQSTPKGRQSMPLEPASGHMAMALDRWEVESDSALSVRVDFRQTSYELKMVQDPPARVLRLRFVKQGGHWLFDGAAAGG